MGTQFGSMNMGQMSPILNMGGNFGGSNMAVPTATSMNTPSIGGGSNPFLPQFPAGQQTPGMTSPMNTGIGIYGGGSASLSVPNVPNFSANGSGGGGGTGALANMNPFQFANPGPTGSQPGNTASEHDWLKAMYKAEFSSADAAMLWNFMQQGSGYNSQVAQTLIGNQMASMQPQISRGERDIMAQFGGMGLGASSAAGTAYGDYLSQVNLNEEQVTGQILSQLYEQSVQNYMSILMVGQKGSKSGGTSMSDISGLISSLGSYMGGAAGAVGA